jgi:hypothetical protein
MSESLEARLRSLRLDAPVNLSQRALAQASLSSRVRSRHVRRHSLRLPLALVAMFLIGAANLPAAYLFPRYALALADAPVIGGATTPVLRAAGLTNSELTPVDSTAVSSGHTLHLSAVYADRFRTVLIVEIDGQPLQSDRKPLPTDLNPPPPPKGFAVEKEFRLTDQFGSAYRDQRLSTFSPIEVEPLTGLAASTGARLTLHVSAIGYYDFSDKLGMPNPVISGDWTLRATVFQVPGRFLTLPAPGSIGNTHYSVNSLNVSASLLQVHVAVSGEAPEMLRALFPIDPNADAATQRIRGDQMGKILGAYYDIHLLAPDGTEAQQRSGSSGDDQIDAEFVLSGPGVYHLVIGNVATGVYDAPISV